MIAGGSGFLGISLAKHLSSRGASVVILSRNAPRVSGPWSHLSWDARTLGEWKSALDGAAGLINLVGRSVDCIKTPDHQDEILRSRVEATRALGHAMRSVTYPPPVWVQMSTAHIYGDPPNLVCDEDSSFGSGFAPFVGHAWEEAFQASVLPGQRKVILRTSFVIGRDIGAGCGALARLRPLVRFGLGGTIGTGEQGISWIHEIDMNRLFERSLSEATNGGCLHRDRAESGFTAHIYARDEESDENADRSASLRLDGETCRAASAYRSGARNLRKVLSIKTIKCDAV